ncbi:hypothetical protein PPERSA_12597 [Pseudocohnilembus persalinus]|uniref:Poly(3-hydroxybutyrate) depolymerase n=1 Tax=Pseudocohnilembus persalinus TaxID=266149 RepID=A0A0V0QCN7_PSEPJ|nr:hypothetical protein PPERSA_12597 [Pseudocohnilembus persalinus]|eukprot:KRW99921.1 hypothetical protein PPERSA_12597 [Pseudocohnilembus persalinus]
MAVQLEVAYSASIIGTGVVAGGPFMCAQGNINNALLGCMSMPSQINLKSIDQKVSGSGKKIDDISNMADHKVYIYSGTKDSTVKPGVVEKLQTQYEDFFGVSDIKTEYQIPSQHAWITDSYGNDCAFSGSPYMNNCDYDQAGAILKHIYGDDIQEPVDQVKNNLIEFNQSKFTTSGDGLSDKGYYYVPSSCQNGESCKLHIALHGCQMTLADIGTDFVANSGLNEWAENNNIIVLYPQIKKSFYNPSNPNGCFDWWGYTQSSLSFGAVDYATQDGKQMKAIWKMVKSIVPQESLDIFE